MSAQSASRHASEAVALVGDIHGCSTELARLLDAIGERRVVSLGDIVDRGPDPAGCIELLRAREADVVLGNHEDKHFRFRRHEARRRVDPSYRNPMGLGEHHLFTEREVSDDAWEWLEGRCVPYLELRAHRVLAVHAGLQAGVSVHRQKRERICRVQMTKPGAEKSPWGGFRRAPTGEPILTGASARRAKEDGHRWWTEWLEPGADVVVYGHSVMPAPLVSFHDDGVVKHTFAAGGIAKREGVAAVGIDTGVPFGGALTALLLPEWTFVRVEAERTYYGKRSEDEAF